MSTPNADSLGVSKGKAAEMGQKVADTIDQNRGAAASGMESAASVLREKADTLPGGGKVANAAHATADAVGVAADYVRDERSENHDGGRAATREEQSRSGVAHRRGIGIPDSTNASPEIDRTG